MILKRLSTLLLFGLMLMLLGSCTDIDRLDSNIYLNEETPRIDDEYVFKVIEILESDKYIKDEIEYDSSYENGVFISLRIVVSRKTLENSEDLEISSSWFKLKRGVGFTVWKSTLGETISANKHIEAVESSLEPFIPEKGESIEIVVVFDIGENYLGTDRVLTLEIDRPWSVANAKEVVLIERPTKS